jgi:hypothetical protein
MRDDRKEQRRRDAQRSVPAPGHLRRGEPEPDPWPGPAPPTWSGLTAATDLLVVMPEGGRGRVLRRLTQPRSRRPATLGNLPPARASPAPGAQLARGRPAAVAGLSMVGWARSPTRLATPGRLRAAAFSGILDTRPGDPETAPGWCWTCSAPRARTRWRCGATPLARRPCGATMTLTGWRPGSADRAVRRLRRRPPGPAGPAGGSRRRRPRAGGAHPRAEPQLPGAGARLRDRSLGRRLRPRQPRLAVLATRPAPGPAATAAHPPRVVASHLHHRHPPDHPRRYRPRTNWLPPAAM